MGGGRAAYDDRVPGACRGDRPNRLRATATRDHLPDDVSLTVSVSVAFPVVEPGGAAGHVAGADIARHHRGGRVDDDGASADLDRSARSEHDRSTGAHVPPH